MVKEWFVFWTDHHEGPFSIEQMREFFGSGRLDGGTLVWREGQEDWMPLESVAPLRRLLLEDGRAPEPPPPPLPPLPADEESPPGEPAGEAPAAGPSAPSEPSVPLEPSAPPGPPEVSAAPARRSSGRRLFAAVCCLLAVLSLAGLGAWLYVRRFGPPGTRPVPEDVAREEAGRLEELPDSATGDHLPVLSEDGRGLWFAFGHPLTGRAEIDLRSKEGEVLADHTVEAVSSGRMEGGLVRFSDFEILRGEDLAPGEYDYGVRLYPDNLATRLGTLLEEAYPEGYRWARPLVGPFVLEGTLSYYGPVSDGEFGDRLESFNKDKEFRQRGLPLIDQLEKLKVFFSMMEQIGEVFERDIPKVERGEDFGAIEDHYVKNISPLLQKMVLDSHRQAVLLMDSRMGMSAEHLEIFENGKEVAAFVSRSIEMTTNVDEYTPEIRRDITERFRKDYNEVLAKLNAVLEKKKKQSEEFLDN